MKAGYIIFYLYMALLASLVGASGSFAFKKNKTEHEKRQEQMWLLTFYITLPMFVASAIVAGGIYFGTKNTGNSTFPHIFGKSEGIAGKVGGDL